MELYEYQKQTVEVLLNGKHICVADCGCLAKGTPVLMANGQYKNIENIEYGDEVWSYDDEGQWVKNTVDTVIRNTLNPKPMLQLEYEGETIKTTYDHPFFNGEGYYPLYQLAWGALEAGQRVQLKLLCEQYGQTFDNKALWCKHSSSNEACIGQGWLLQNCDEQQDSKGAQGSGTNMVGQPYQLAMCEPHRLQPQEQQGRKPRVVYLQIQRMVECATREHQTTNFKQEQEGNSSRPPMGEEVLSREYDWTKQSTKRGTLPNAASEISPSDSGHNKRLGNTRPIVCRAEPYYSLCLRNAPYTYCIGRLHNYITHNTGKTAISLTWAKQTGKQKVIVITTASVRDAKQYEHELAVWYPNWRVHLEVISWAGLAKWVQANWSSLGEWAVIADEVASAKAGVSSIRGKAFLQIASRTDCWTGYTATPGDKWIDFYAYMVACKKVRTKTEFRNKYCIEQRYPFPDIIGYQHEDELKRFWTEISYTPDSSSVEASLPDMTHQTITFKQPSYYKQLMKTHTNEDGEFLDNASAMAHAARRLCCTPQKLTWLREFVENLGTNCVIFYSYTEEGNQIEEVVKKAIGKEGRVWRIDGKLHEVPTAETIGKRDVVLAQWQAGALGLNLQFMNYWVSASPNYSYSISVQARKRIHRLGQTKTCHYYYLVCEHTIEEDVYKILRTKGDFAIDVWWEGQQ